MSDAFWRWYEKGLNNSWCSEMVCDTHDGPPMTDDEMEAWSEGDDICIVVVRIHGTERLDEEQ
jgi:hypothetical protein